MESDQLPHSATTHGSGQSVVVNLGDSFKHAAIVIGALIIALIISCTISLVAYSKAKDAETQSALWAYWAQRVESNLVSKGIQLPPDPNHEGK